MTSDVDVTTRSFMQKVNPHVQMIVKRYEILIRSVDFIFVYL